MAKRQQSYDVNAATKDLEKSWKAIFDKHGEEGQARIPLQELQKLLPDLPMEVQVEMVNRLDQDADGRISHSEFIDMVHHLKNNHPRLLRLLHYTTAMVVPHNQRSAVIARYVSEYKCCPPPLFMPLISIIEIAVFIYYETQLTGDQKVDIEGFLIYNPHCRVQAWRFLTYMMVHAGWLHLIFNVIMQLALGIPLEMVHKWWRVGLVYLIGVVAGSLGSSISDPNTFLAGASGGVYAIMAAHLANVIMNWGEMQFGWVRAIALGIVAISDVANAVVERYQGKNNRISYAAHIAGALAGLLIGTRVLRNLRVHKWEDVLAWVCFSIFGLLVGCGVLWNILYPSYFPAQQCPPYLSSS